MSSKTLKRLSICFGIFIFSSLSAEESKEPHPPRTPRECFENEHYHIEVYGAYTYWVPYQIGLELCYEEGDANTLGEYVEPVFNASSGFKAGINANTFYDHWHLSLNYTWFNYNPGYQENIPFDGDYDAATEFENILPIALIVGLHSKYNVQFNRIDGRISKEFFLGEFVKFAPFLGILGAFDQSYLDATYDGIAEAFGTGELKYNQKWWGAGPSLGTVCHYFFNQSFGLFLNAATAMLIANHDISNYQLFELNDFDATSSTNNKTYFYSVEPMVDMSLGLFYTLCNKTIDLSIELGWEIQTYFSHLGFRPDNYDYLYNRNNFSLQGLTAGLTLGF